MVLARSCEFSADRGRWFAELSAKQAAKSRRARKPHIETCVKGPRAGFEQPPGFGESKPCDIGMRRLPKRLGEPPVEMEGRQASSLCDLDE